MPARRWDAVIFDYGRVLSHPPSLQEMGEFAAMAGLPPERFRELYSGLRRDYDSGRCDYRRHWQTIAAAAGYTFSSYQVQQLVAMESQIWMRVNPRMLALAREVRAAGLRTAILSNMPPDLLRDMRREFQWLDEFAVQVWSCEAGCVKPDPEIYHACLTALEVPAERALFFDDRPNNVEGARALGIEAHVFESFEQAQAIVAAGLNHG